MRTLSTVTVFLLLIPFSYGQLTIKPASHRDSYLYVKGTVLFVEQGVNLEKNAEGSPTEASIYLRREAQLIQGDVGAINSGDGLLSVFQEGTSNSYDYNYWSSPVSTGPGGNGNFGIRMLYAPVTATRSTPSSQTISLDGNASPLTISSRWIFTYSGDSYSDWNPISDNTSIPAGYGFTMKGVNGLDPTLIEGVKNNPGNAQRYDFRGRPNNGPIVVPVVSGEYTLVGNPFPSALDLSLFLLENSGSGVITTSCGGTIIRNPASTGIAYFWDSVENGNSHYLQDYVGGYGAFSPVDPCTAGIYERPVFKSYGPSDAGGTGTSGNHYDRRYLPIAQGFMLQAAGNGEVRFKNYHRSFRKEGDLSEFKQAKRDERSAKPIQIPKIRLEALINNDYKRNLTFAFWPSATPGTDPAMDAEAYSTASTDIGILHNDRNYVIDVRPFEKTEEIPLFLKVEDEQASLEFKVSDMEDLEVREIYLFDSLYNIYFPLTKIAYKIILQKGIYHDRFRITFSDKSYEPAEDSSESALEIFHDPESDIIMVLNPERQPIASVAIFDLLGRLLFNQLGSGSEKFQVSTSSFANSLYIVRVITEDQRIFSKKINIH